METINWGIIGCGDVCEVKSGPAFYKIPHSTLKAVMRRDEEKIKDFARRHNVPAYYTDARQVINDPDVNAIYVATPPSTHKKYAIMAMRAGKPVYVEKPMALNHAECREMIQVSEETGQKLFVAFYRRALPYFLQVKELLESGVIGNVLTVNTQFFRPPAAADIDPAQHTWRVKKEIAGGGYFFDLAPHTLDILDFLLGEIIQVNGLAGNMANYYEVEDTVSASFRFKSGVQGTGQWCFVSSATRDLVEITGTKGSIEFNVFGANPISLTTPSGILFYEPEHPQHIQQPLIETIVNELLGKEQCPSTGISGARTAWVMDEIMRAKANK